MFLVDFFVGWMIGGGLGIIEVMFLGWEVDGEGEEVVMLGWDVDGEEEDIEGGDIWRGDWMLFVLLLEDMYKKLVLWV